MMDSVDGFIKGLVAVHDSISTKSADGQPIKAKTEGYTKLEKRLIDMFTENTGVAMLDSGGAYGRAWQRNRKIESWNDLPEIKVEAYNDGDVLVTMSCYHFLRGHLEITDTSEMLDKEFRKLMDTNDDCGLVNMEKFAKDYHIYSGVTYTYNFENILDHDLQFMIIEYEGETYILLQIHLGCDARGGLTNPRIFVLPESDYFYIHMTDVEVFCKKCGQSWYSDNCGYNFYYGGNHSNNQSLDGECEEELHWLVKDEKVYHKNCKGELEFYTNTSY